MPVQAVFRDAFRRFAAGFFLFSSRLCVFA